MGSGARVWRWPGQTQEEAMSESTWFIDPEAGAVSVEDDDNYDEAYGPGDPHPHEGRLVEDDEGLRKILKVIRRRAAFHATPSTGLMRSPCKPNPDLLPKAVLATK